MSISREITLIVKVTNACNMACRYCFIEPSVKGAAVGSRYQFERLGYFAVDRDSSAGKLVSAKWVTGLRSPKGVHRWGDDLLVADTKDLEMAHLLARLSGRRSSSSMSVDSPSWRAHRQCRAAFFVRSPTEEFRFPRGPRRFRRTPCRSRARDRRGR